MSSDYESYSGVKVAEFGLDAIEARMALEMLVPRDIEPTDANFG